MKTAIVWFKTDLRITDNETDANMVEIKLTGFMSNRERQNVASYLCNDLALDWRYSAAAHRL